jgi:hypothetical protein
MHHPLHFTHAHHNFRRTARAARQSASSARRGCDRPARPDSLRPARDRRQPARARADQGARVQRHPRRARRDARTDLRQAGRGGGATHRQTADTVAAVAERTGGKRETGTRDADDRAARGGRGSRQANRKNSRTRQGRQDNGKIRTPGATPTESHRASSCPTAVCRCIESAWPAGSAVRPGIAGTPPAPNALTRQARP